MLRFHKRILTVVLFRFITSNKRSQVLPHMPQEKRKFVYSVRIRFGIRRRCYLRFF